MLKLMLFWSILGFTSVVLALPSAAGGHEDVSILHENQHGNLKKKKDDDNDNNNNNKIAAVVTPTTTSCKGSPLSATITSAAPTTTIITTALSAAKNADDGGGDPLSGIATVTASSSGYNGLSPIGSDRHHPHHDKGGKGGHFDEDDGSHPN